MTITELYSLFLEHPVVTTDSRNCPEGSLFFALKGDYFDGNKFAEQALDAGCAFAIVDDSLVVTDERMILVDNVLITLQQLAKTHRKSFKIPVIGITGTNGKTTTKELTTAILSQKYKVLATQGNLNNHIGVPLTLLQLTHKHDIAVIEMGANHPGEIGELTSIVCPDYGLITNVGYAHLEGFGSLEGVIKTKGALYDFLREVNGVVFIHQNNNYLTAIAGGLNKVAYGEMKYVAPIVNQYTQSLFIGGSISESHPFLSFKWQHNRDITHVVNTNLVGGYNLENALAGIAIGVYFDIPPEKINEALTNYEPINNRSQLKKTEHNELIIDAYNANPSSMKTSLDNFSPMSFSPKAVILGDMLELGEKSKELHADVIKQLEACDVEQVLLCGEKFSDIEHPYISFLTVEQLNEYLKINPLKGYYILIKGSRGIRLEKTIAFL